MPDPVTSTVSNQASIPGGDSQIIHFRPGQPGRIAVQSLPSPHVVKTEAGLLAAINLRSPGSAKPLASVKFPNSSLSLGLSYNASAADLVSPGSWECEVVNESVQPIEFSTDVTFPFNPLPTVSMDVAFLNLIFAKIVDAAAIRIHLESTGDGSAATSLSISPDIAALLNVPTLTAFHIADQHKTILDVTDVVFRIQNLDSDPNYPILILWPTPASLKIVIRFDTASAKIIGENWHTPDINLDVFNIEITVGFDGSFQPVCTVSANLAFDNIDVSSDISNAVQSAVIDQLNKNPGFAALLDPPQVRVHIDKLFTSLMRLPPNANIQSYGTDGQTLTVSYYLEEL